MIGVEKLQDIRQRLEAAVTVGNPSATSAGNTEVADALARFLRPPAVEPSDTPAPAAPPSAGTTSDLAPTPGLS